MAIEKITVTDKGHALLAKVPKGTGAPVTRWQFGTGVLPAQTPDSAVTALAEPLKYLPIASVTNSGTQAVIMGQFVNTDMEAFTWEELGPWARDPDEGEILLAYGNARGAGDLIEAGNVKLREFTFGVQIGFSSAAEVTFESQKSLIFATLKDLEDVAAKIGGYYQTFEAEQWEDGAIRIPKVRHQITPVRGAAMCRVTQHVDRTALGYYGASAALGRRSITNAVAAALDANKTTPGTYPVGPDGHPKLTWHQVQYYILDGVLTTDSAARSKAEAQGWNWRDRDITGAESSLTLDDVLAAAHIPALGGSSAGLDALCSDIVLQALRLRRKAGGAGDVVRYDLDGTFILNGWGAFGTAAEWDLDTGDLVLRSDSPYAGAVLATG